MALFVEFSLPSIELQLSLSMSGGTQSTAQCHHPSPLRNPHTVFSIVEVQEFWFHLKGQAQAEM